MKKSLAILTIPLSVFALPLSARTARAEEVVVQRTEVTTDQTSTTGPNRTLLHSGIWVLGLSYVPAIVVAAESSRSEDRKLYIPVAGPWMDLASAALAHRMFTAMRQRARCSSLSTAYSKASARWTS